MTEWRIVPSWPAFEASSEGDIRRTNSGRLLKGTVYNNGYRYINTTDPKDGSRKAVGIHVLVCEAFHGPKPDWAELVRHRDGDGLNNRYSNLRWGTHKQNAADRRLHGRDTIGSAHGCAKIDEHDVIAIFCLSRRRMIAEEIGALFDLSATTINRILARELWEHVVIPDVLMRLVPSSLPETDTTNPVEARDGRGGA